MVHVAEQWWLSNGKPKIERLFMPSQTRKSLRFRMYLSCWDLDIKFFIIRTDHLDLSLNFASYTLHSI